MTALFTITGYPRSRTAWLANWLTTDRSWCYHEASRFATDAESYRKHLGLAMQIGAEWIGNSDSALLAHPDWIPKEYPLVVVNRRESDLRDSLSRLLSTKAAKGLINRYRDAFEAIAKDADLVVDYRGLSELPYLEEVWKACVPGLEFHRARTLALQSMNVQVPYEHRLKEARCPSC